MSSLLERIRWQEKLISAPFLSSPSTRIEYEFDGFLDDNPLLSCALGLYTRITNFKLEDFVLRAPENPTPVVYRLTFAHVHCKRGIHSPKIAKTGYRTLCMCNFLCILGLTLEQSHLLKLTDLLERGTFQQVSSCDVLPGSR